MNKYLSEVPPEHHNVADQQRSEPWGRYLVHCGYEPYNTESSARRIAEHAVVDLGILVKLVRDAGKEIRKLDAHVKLEFARIPGLRERLDQVLVTFGYLLTETPVSPPTVQLGDTVTRDGRKARVICIDLKNPQLQSMYVLVNDEGVEHSPIMVNSQGRYLNDTSMTHRHDLVGHLPPEPPKPREVQICFRADGTVLSSTVSKVPLNGFTLFREVLP